jgi:hypothetical protein
MTDSPDRQVCYHFLFFILISLQDYIVGTKRAKRRSAVEHGHSWWISNQLVAGLFFHVQFWVNECGTPSSGVLTVYVSWRFRSLVGAQGAIKSNPWMLCNSPVISYMYNNYSPTWQQLSYVSRLMLYSHRKTKILKCSYLTSTVSCDNY